MNPIQILKTMIKSDLFTIQTETAFRPGQIISGKVSALFPNQIAEVQVGTQKLIAQLEVPLSVNERYWFQVQQGEGKIHLKMVAQDGGDGTRSKLPSAQLAAQVGLSPTKENIQLLEFAVRSSLPISKEWIELGAAWLKNLPEQAPGLETIKLMQNKGLPFTEMVFSALLSARDPEPIQSVMERLSFLLKNDPLETSGHLQDILNKLLGKTDFSLLPNIDWGDGKAVGRQIKQMIKTIGFNYENELLQNGVDSQKTQNEPSLKPLLIRYLNENPGDDQKHAAEQLLNRVTALQLLSSDSGAIQQFVAQIPVFFPHMTKEATIQWNGRKQENGRIDPNYCRILFYLELETIGETLVDVQIQNRIMTLSVMNERKELKEVAGSLIKPLKEKLSQLDYHLTSFSFLQPSDQQPLSDRIKKAAIPAAHYDLQGVDLRI
ncbi:hypothetical protein ACF5W4_06720 [Bacillota bacterium Lsc_1132]